MKTGFYQNSGVRCPNYRRQNKYTIVCQGPVPLTCIHLAAGSPVIRKEWQKRYCGYDSDRGENVGASNYADCPIYQMSYREDENAGED